MLLYYLLTHLYLLSLCLTTSPFETICLRRYPNQFSMETTTATTATLHKCTQCNYSHIKITNLRQHMLSHTKPHKCIHCNYGAAKIGQLNLHVLKKHPTTAQAKEIAIKKATKKRTIHKSPAAEPIAKKIKVQSNNGEKKKVYYCDICAKNFAGASGIWYHNKHVHGAETQLRPRKPKNNSFAVPSN